MNKIIFPALTVIVFFGYYFTMAPSLVELDSGELATAQATLGIAHPTGYPLFTLLGYLFLQLPTPFTPVFMSNLLSLIWTLGSVLMFALTLRLVLSNLNFFKSKKDQAVSADLNEKQILSIVFISSLIYAFSRTVWIQSTSVEVYSLHLLLVTSILYFFFHALISSGGEFKLNISWFIFAFLLGLGFTNHLSTIYLIPGIVVLFFLQYKFSLKYITKLLILFPVFLFPVIVLNYLLMLRSSQHPALNWGNPSNWENLIYHISGLQFRGLQFAEDNSPLEKLFYFFKTMVFNPFSSVPDGGEFGIFIIIALIGVYYLYRISKKLTITLTVFFFTSLLSINYRINDIDAYFLLSYITVILFISAGLVYLMIQLQVKRKLLFTGLSIIFSVIILQYIYNYYQVSQRDVYIYEDFTNGVFNNLDSNAVIFCNDQDPFIATSYYYQFVEGKRKDITKIVVPFLNEKWYAGWVNQLAPGLAERSGNSTKLDLQGRPLYISLGLYSSDTLMNWLGLSRDNFAPDGMFLKLKKDHEYIPSKFSPMPLRLSGRSNGYTYSIEEYIEIMYNMRAHYELLYQNDARAYELLRELTEMKVRLNYSNWSYLFVQPIDYKD